MKEHVRDTEQERFAKYEETQVRAALREHVRDEESENRAKQSRGSEAQVGAGEAAPAPLQAEATDQVPCGVKPQKEKNARSGRKDAERSLETQNVRRKISRAAQAAAQPLSSCHQRCLAEK